ncbi:hypothetical protein [Plasmodium yoelii yoelii]|uniref:Uncharacterized protein n=1 Tax=Plasmodium yoelii yoelii TaxID=73239 RepID=Q7R6Z7_PLAYO|nr:hypothetical protein [Plasmodium yoelii yoelii]
MDGYLRRDRQRAGGQSAGSRGAGNDAPGPPAELRARRMGIPHRRRSLGGTGWQAARLLAARVAARRLAARLRPASPGLPRLPGGGRRFRSHGRAGQP